jgi:hypothetical protein
MAMNSATNNPTHNSTNQSASNGIQKPTMNPAPVSSGLNDRDSSPKNREHQSEMGEKADHERAGRMPTPGAQENPVKNKPAESDSSKN